MAVLQIRSTLISPMLPNLAMLLFSWPIKGTLSKLCRTLVLSDNITPHCALNMQPQEVKMKILTKILFLPTQSTVVLQKEDGRPLTQRTLIRHGTEDHSSRGYRMSKTGCAITRRKRHIKPSSISTEEYLQNEMTKTNKSTAANKLMNSLTSPYISTKVINYVKQLGKWKTVAVRILWETRHIWKNHISKQMHVQQAQQSKGLVDQVLDINTTTKIIM